MQRFSWITGWFLAAAAAALALFPAGCEVDSVESTSRNVGLVVVGFYAGVDGAPLVSRNSGNPIQYLNIRQAGDQLEAIDNNGMVFRGTIGNADTANATYTLRGPTTSGQQGTMSGSITVSGNTGTIRGTWIEPSLTSAIYGQATDVPEPSPGTNPTNSTGLAVSPASTTVALGGSRAFTASGGDGSYTWSGANHGSLSSQTGASVNYTRTSTGSDTISVRDGQARTASATVN